MSAWIVITVRGRLVWTDQRPSNAQVKLSGNFCRVRLWELRTYLQCAVDESIYRQVPWGCQNPFLMWCLRFRTCHHSQWIFPGTAYMWLLCDLTESGSMLVHVMDNHEDLLPEFIMGSTWYWISQIEDSNQRGIHVQTEENPDRYNLLAPASTWDIKVPPITERVGYGEGVATSRYREMVSPMVWR